VAIDLDAFGQLGQGRLPGLIGIEVEEIEAGHVRMRLPLRDELLAPNGYLHAGTVVALADSSCGYGCIASLPDGATGFTTPLLPDDSSHYFVVRASDAAGNRDANDVERQGVNLCY